MSPPMDHWVSTKPLKFDSAKKLTPEQERFYMASQWQLMWWKLKRHRLALISGAILALFYLSAAFAEFLAPYGLHSRHTEHIYAPPQSVHLLHEGRLRMPFVYPQQYRLNMETLKREYGEDRSRPMSLRFLCRGKAYEFWGLMASDLHLVCPPEGGEFFFLGTDRLGRDLLSRILYGGRISLTIGLIGITLSTLFGVILGGLAGYYGGRVDSLVQRLIEIVRSFPELPLWLALSALLPVSWSPVLVFFGITLILALIDWTGLARAARSKFLALREEDYCVSAEIMGASPQRIIGRHLLPGFSSHLIASASLSVPNMILGETALSFLGLGLRPPITSWGVLLNEAQNINVVALYPWLILPVTPVIIVILAFNFFGDGLRDAADPYKSVQ